MAIVVITDAYVTVNGGTDISDHVTQATINYSAEMLDASRMGHTTRVRKAGVYEWSVELEIQQDFANSSIDDILWALVGAAAAELVAAHDGDSVGTATNPSYTGDAVLEGYTPLGNSWGELATTSATFHSAGVLTRDDTT